MKEILLQAPGKNALGSELMRSIRRELAAAGGEAVVLTGAGDAFSAGLNLKEVAALDAPGMRQFLELLEEMVLDLFNYPGPTLALVNGHAIAGGCVVALTCDYRIAASTSGIRIGLNEVALGLRFPPRVLRLAQARIPAGHLERVLLGAGLMPPAEARELGLIDEVADAADASRIAGERLAALDRHPRHAYAATKHALRAGLLDVPADERARWYEESLPLWTAPELKERILGMLRR
jgi:enoyl-CoA hydratase